MSVTPRSALIVGQHGGPRALRRGHTRDVGSSARQVLSPRKRPRRTWARSLLLGGLAGVAAGDAQAVADREPPAGHPLHGRGQLAAQGVKVKRFSYLRRA